MAPKEFSELMSLTPVPAQAKGVIRAAMKTAGRFYHNADHLAQLWRRHRRHADAEGFDAPAIETLIACAIAYHDIIYDMGRRDNEERSAEVWLSVGAETPLPEADRLWVAETIRATKDHMAYRPVFDIERPPEGNGEILKERARVWVLDLDLSPLGDTEDVFNRNTDNLRREAGHIPEADWRKGQVQFLTNLLEAPRIFRTPTLFRIYEGAARRNMEQLRTRLGG